MYIHIPMGFFEIDRWDGEPIPVESHMKIVNELKTIGQNIYVVRSRDKKALDALCSEMLGEIETLESPGDWDYEYRVYLTHSQMLTAWAVILVSISYRNFKAFTHEAAPEQYDLAQAIWTAAKLLS